MTLDVKNFYLNSPVKLCEYHWLKIEDILEDVKQQYKLSEKIMQDEHVLLTTSRVFSTGTPCKKVNSTWLHTKLTYPRLVDT